MLNVRLPLVVEIVLPLILMLSVCKLDNVPKLVMFGCAAVVKVPAIFVALMLPLTTTSPVPLGVNVRLSFDRVAEISLPLIDIPSTCKDVRVPKLVIFVCAAVDKVPTSDVAVSEPFTVVLSSIANVPVSDTIVLPLS